VEKERIDRKQTESTEAYQLFLKGRFYSNTRRADDLKTATDYFKQALKRDPNYALAYSGLAQAYVLIPEYAGLSSREYFPQAENAASRALELDQNLAEAHHSTWICLATWMGLACC